MHLLLCGATLCISLVVYICNMSCLKAVFKPSQILLKQRLVPSRNKQHIGIIITLVHLAVYTVLFGLLIFNIFNGIKHNKTMFVNRMMCILIPGLCILAKWLGIRINGRHYLSIFENLNSNIFNTQNKILNRHLQLAERICGLLLRYFAITTGVLFLVSCGLPIALKTQPMVPCPIDIGKYQIIYNLLHLPLTVYFAINSPCLDVLLMSLLAICIAELEILKEQLIGLEDCDSNTRPKEEHTLRECVALHKMIIE